MWLLISPRVATLLSYVFASVVVINLITTAVVVEIEMEVMVLVWVESAKLVLFSLVNAIEEIVSVGVVPCDVNCIGVKSEDLGATFGRINGSERKCLSLKGEEEFLGTEK